EAKRVAKSVLNSPLVKTMVHGADPNVGRLLMAVGKCFECTIQPQTTDAWVNGYQVVKGGERLAFDDDIVRQTLKQEVVDLEIALGVGGARPVAYGCDVTTGYIRENAAYYSRWVNDGSRMTDAISASLIRHPSSCSCFPRCASSFVMSRWPSEISSN